MKATWFGHQRHGYLKVICWAGRTTLDQVEQLRALGLTLEGGVPSSCRFVVMTREHPVGYGGLGISIDSVQESPESVQTFIVQTFIRCRDHFSTILSEHLV